MDGKVPITLVDGELELWKRKYQVVKRKCDEFEQLNEALFAKAKRIHVMIEKVEAEKRFLIQRLERYEVVEFPRTKVENVEDYRPEVKRERHNPGVPPPLMGPFPTDNHLEGVRLVQLPVESNSYPRAGIMKQPIATTAAATTAAATTAAPTTVSYTGVTFLQPASSTERPITKATTSKQKRATKTAPGEKQGRRRGSRRRKAGVDPNAPKKPSNAFFWFCQERKPSLQDQFKGRGVAGQHDLTKVLAKQWSEITPEDKKKYYDLYREDKKRYDRQMQEHMARSQKQQYSQMVSDAPTAPTGSDAAPQPPH